MSNTMNYTPGYTENAVQFMARRTAETHAGFFTPNLRPGMDVLDCGCGPGAITVGLAKRVAPGQVIGVDYAESQIHIAEDSVAADRPGNLQFQTASATSLPFPSESFDAVFSHALLEHLNDPMGAVREFFRVLRPGGIVGVRSPDWGGFILAPPDPHADDALITYRRIQESSGGDTLVGRKLGNYLSGAGFVKVRMGADYECYPDREVIAEYLGKRLESTNIGAAQALRAWAQQPGGMFAQAWVNAVGLKPKGLE